MFMKLLPVIHWLYGLQIIQDDLTEIHKNRFRPRQNGRHFPDDIFKCIFLNEYVCISITISPKFVPKGPIEYIPSFVQIMIWHRPVAPFTNMV